MTGIGHRLPNFVRLDLAGVPVMLYDLCCGEAVFIALARPEHSAGVLSALAALSPQSAKVRRVLLIDGIDAPIAESPDDVVILMDSDGRVSARLCHGDGVCCIATNPRLEVIGRTERLDGAPSLWRHALSAAAEPAPAPVLVIPDILNAVACAALIDRHMRGPQTESGMYRQTAGGIALVPDPMAKSRTDVLLDDEAMVRHIGARLAATILPRMQADFDFTPRRFEQFKIACYDADAGGHFAVHRDNTTPDAQARRIALTLSLNRGEYEGGGLIFPEYDGVKVHEPPSGGGIIFACHLAHRVMPVTRGRRYVLLSFFS